MYRYFVLSAFILASFIETASASFYGTYTNVAANTAFAKREGTYNLLIRWTWLTNPFGNSTIVQTVWGGIFWQSTWTVDGANFDASHPLWAYADANGAPDQTPIIMTSVAQKQYKYDATDAYCGIIRVFNSDDDSQVTLTWAWTALDIEAKVKCQDVTSGCQTEYSDFIPVFHGDTSMGTTFWDVANNVGFCTSNFSSSLVWVGDTPITGISAIFIDRIKPVISSVRLGATTLLSGSSVNALAEWSGFTLDFYDTGSATYGISWISSYSFTATLLSDHIGTYNTVVCTQTGSYVPYNLSGLNSLADVKTVNVPCNPMTRIGTYKVDFTTTDYVGNSITQTYTVTIYPSNNLAPIVQVWEAKDSKYANDTDTYTYKMNVKDIYGNPIYGKNIDYVNQEWLSPTFQTIKTDMVNFLWDDALIEDYTGPISSTGYYEFSLKSYAPGQFDESFQLRLKKWDNNYVDIPAQDNLVYADNGEKNSFRKPFYSLLHIVGDDFKIGTMQVLELLVTRDNCTLCGWYTISEYKDTLVGTGDYIVEEKRNERDLTTNPRVDMALNYAGNTNVGSGVPWVEVHPYITYPLSGKNISFYITQNYNGFANDSVVLAGAKFLGVKVIGTIQGTGKQELTGQDTNFADLTKSTLRDTIRKNAITLARSMPSGTTANGVHYEEWDYSISGDLPYETLIVKNGNVTIEDDLNTSGEKLWIIIIKDNSQDETIGNLYIKPNVKYIDAVIYADGSARSVDNAGNEYGLDSPTRTIDLNNQLFLLGSLFTKNTIWGAIGTAGSFILPGGYKTTDFDKAVQYDLNYIRTGNDGWDRNGNMIADEDEYQDFSFIIWYNTEIQSNPPKWFQMK